MSPIKPPQTVQVPAGQILTIEIREPIVITLAEITQRICDPGAFVPRGENYTEGIPQWGARAVLALLAEKLKGRLI